jgi:hypothetical protein
MFQAQLWRSVSKLEWRKEMRKHIGKPVFVSTFAKVVLLAVMLICGTTGQVFGQETVAGKFTLTKNTRLGKKVLSAGTYTFSVEPTGAGQSVGAIKGARQIVQVILRSETEGSVTLAFAMASRSEEYTNTSRLVLESVNNEVVMHSMYLDWWK